ncbi:MFS transporter [Actinomycetospora callitridis]|uniref:MFS transporter n=1 Tax=Actinomycetospora callitridis TaxID=913944 RepID=UPI0023656547|nr:MFS transporter [Actinomycetospora callitridis]MDD7921312.1 MFS transporter [Actinomycetospora callitridis]
MADTGAATAGKRRALTGAVLLDLAVSPLFAWDVFTDSLGRDLGVSHALLAGVFSVGLAAFMLGVLVGGRAADTFPPRRLALIALGGTMLGLLGSAVASSVVVLFLTFGVLVGGSTGLGYATAVRVAGTVASGRGLALGLVVSAYAAGTAVLAPLASALLAAVGRSWTFVVLAGTLGVLLAIAATLVPGAAPTSRRPRDRSVRPIRPSRPVIALWLAFGLGSAPALAAFAQAGSLAGDVAVVTLAVVLLNLGNFAGRLIAGPPLRPHRPARRTPRQLGAARARLHPPGARRERTPRPGCPAPARHPIRGALDPDASSHLGRGPARTLRHHLGLVFTSWGIAGLVAPVGAATLAPQLGYDGVFVAFLVVATGAWACVLAFTRLTRSRA